MTELSHSKGLTVKSSHTVMCTPLNHISEGCKWVCNHVVRCVKWIRRSISSAISCFKQLRKDPRIAEKASYFNSLLEKLEEVRVPFNNSTIDQVDSAYSRLFLPEAASIQQEMQPCKSKRAVAERERLARNIVALQYRIGKDKGGLDPLQSPELDKRLLNAAEAWKKGLFLKYSDELSDDNLKALQETCKYPEFVNLLLGNTRLQQFFFSWIMPLSNKHQPFGSNSVQTFIEFPAHTALIQKCFLKSRIQRFAGKPLRVTKVPIKGGGFMKDLTLDMEKDQTISILHKEATVKFRGYNLHGYKEMTVSQIFESFRNKPNTYGHLEILEGSITLWDPLENGEWNELEKKFYQPDYEREDWYKQHPPQEVLTLAQAKERYGEMCNGVDWIVTYKATRSSHTMDVLGNHTYFEIATPREVGKYEIRTFGLITKEFPIKIADFVKIVAQPVEAALSSPDENWVYAHREHTGVSYPAKPEQGLDLMRRLGKTAKSCQDGKKKFQILNKNCNAFVVSKGEKALGSSKVPDYEISFWDLEVSDPLFGKMFKVIRKFPSFRERAVGVFFYVLGASRSVTYFSNKGKQKTVSLSNNPPWGPGAGFLCPAQLFEFLKGMRL